MTLLNITIFLAEHRGEQSISSLPSGSAARADRLVAYNYSDTPNGTRSIAHAEWNSVGTVRRRALRTCWSNYNHNVIIRWTLYDFGRNDDFADRQRGQAGNRFLARSV